MSLSSIVNYNKRFGLSSKTMQYYSTLRNEDDRVAFWVNGLHHPTRPGVFLVPYTTYVDIDEMCVYFSENFYFVHVALLTGYHWANTNSSPRLSLAIVDVGILHCRSTGEFDFAVLLDQPRAQSHTFVNQG